MDSSESAADYRDLIAWQKAMGLVMLVYRASASWPDAERFGLTPQARRAAVSVAANIAEGEGRMNRGDLCCFLHIAHGSLVGRLMNGLFRSLSARSP